MHRDHDGSLKLLLLEALAALLGANVVRAFGAWAGAELAPVRIETRRTGRRPD